MNLDFSGFSNYAVVQNSNLAFGNLLFEDCRIQTCTGKPLTYISMSTRSFDNIVFDSCEYYFANTSSQSLIISLGTSTATYNNLTVRNCVFFTDENKTASKFRIVQGSASTFRNVTIENNTFANLVTDTSFYLYVGTMETVVVKNNIFWTDKALPNNMGLLRAAVNWPTAKTVKDNLSYCPAGDSSWQIAYGGLANLFEGAENVIAAASDPLASKDYVNGVFVPTSEYSAYGASR